MRDHDEEMLFIFLQNHLYQEKIERFFMILDHNGTCERNTSFKLMFFDIRDNIDFSMSIHTRARAMSVD